MYYITCIYILLCVSFNLARFCRDKNWKCVRVVANFALDDSVTSAELRRKLLMPKETSRIGSIGRGGREISGICFIRLYETRRGAKKAERRRRATTITYSSSRRVCRNPPSSAYLSLSRNGISSLLIMSQTFCVILEETRRGVRDRGKTPCSRPRVSSSAIRRAFY